MLHFQIIPPPTGFSWWVYAQQKAHGTSSNWLKDSELWMGILAQAPV